MEDTAEQVARVAHLVAKAPQLSRDELEHLQTFAPLLEQVANSLRSQRDSQPRLQKEQRTAQWQQQQQQQQQQGRMTSSSEYQNEPLLITLTSTCSSVSTVETVSSVGSSSSRRQSMMDTFRRNHSNPSPANSPVSASSSSLQNRTSSTTNLMSMSGFLRMRLSSKGWRMKTWYCTLYKTSFFWYPTKTDGNNATNIKGGFCVLSANENSGEGYLHVYPNAFTIESNDGQVYFCSAPTKDEQIEWIDRINFSASEYVNALNEERASSSKSVAVTAQGQVLDEELETKKTRIVGYSTMGGAAGGALVGSVVPVIGTIIGGVVGGMWSHHRAKAKRSERVKAAIERKIHYQDLIHLDSQCTECSLDFGKVTRLRHYCESCFHAFCHAHCNHDVFLAQSGENKLKRVCNACFYRQEFITFVVAMTSLTLKVKETGMNVYSSVQTKATSWPCREEELVELKMLLKGAHFSVLNVMCLMKKHLDHEVMFARCICLLIPLFEKNPSQLDKFWIQYLALYKPLVHALAQKQLNHDHMNVQVEFFIGFTLAVCRRSNHFALRTVWELLAMYEDVKNNADTLCSNFVLLLIYIVSSFHHNSDVVASIWLQDSPKLQAETMVSMMDDFFNVRRAYAQETKLPIKENLSAAWLYAKEPHDLLRTRRYAVSAWRQPGEMYHLFSPIQTESGNYTEMFPNAEASGSGNLEEDLTEEERENLFNDEAVFVNNLTSIAEHLRHVSPVSDRKLQLPSLLKELQVMLPPNAYVPLCEPHGKVLRVLRVLPDEGKVFSTRCRAPTMIVFEAIQEDSKKFAVQNQGRSTMFEDDLELEYIVDDADGEESDQCGAIAPKAAMARPSLRRLDSKMLDHLLCGDDGSSADSQGDDDDDNSDDKQDTTGARRSGSSYSHTLNVEEAQMLYAESTCVAMDQKEESWREKQERIRQNSDLSHLEGWEVVSVIAKSFDDMRQEVFALQLLSLLKRIFDEYCLGLYLRPYRILCTGSSVGLIETLQDSNSIDGIKKTHGSLENYFQSLFGANESAAFKAAQANFISSMAAYSIYCYFFQVKDRHNGNIMLDREGHLIHIDFGFLFGIAPGGAFSLEDAPFKLTVEMVELMGGLESDGYAQFKNLFVDGFSAARQEYIKMLSLIHLTLTESPYPCFGHQNPDRVLRNFRRRLFVNDTESIARPKILHLIDKSYNHWGTRQYDNFQQASNGILP